jgi:hypothetical protein
MILHVAFEDSILYQHIITRRSTFIIYANNANYGLADKERAGDRGLFGLHGI